MKTYKYHYVYTITNPTILDENNNPKISVSTRSVNCKPTEDDFYGTAKITSGTPISKLIKSIIKVCKTKEEATKVKNKIYYKMNSEIISEKKKEYYTENIDKIMEYKAANRAHIKQIKAEHHQRNRDKLNARKKIYAQENADRISKRCHDRYAKKQEQIMREKILDGNKDSDWIFYTLKFTHDETSTVFYKYGITRTSVKSRFTGYSQFSYEVLDEVYGNKHYIRALERIHLNNSQQYAFDFSNKFDFGAGYTECRTKLLNSMEINVK